MTYARLLLSADRLRTVAREVGGDGRLVASQLARAAGTWKDLTVTTPASDNQGG